MSIPPPIAIIPSITLFLLLLDDYLFGVNVVEQFLVLDAVLLVLYHLECLIRGRTRGFPVPGSGVIVVVIVVVVIVLIVVSVVIIIVIVIIVIVVIVIRLVGGDIVRVIVHIVITITTIAITTIIIITTTTIIIDRYGFDILGGSVDPLLYPAHHTVRPHPVPNR